MDRGFLEETIYMYTMRILKRMGNDSMGGKTNRKGLLATGMGMPLVEKGGLGDNIHRPLVGNDERALFTECACQPDRDSGDSDGMESRNKEPNANIEDWGKRACRAGKPGDKWDRWDSRKKFHSGGTKEIGQSRSDSGNSSANLRIHAKR